MKYTSNQRAAIFLVARVTRQLKKNAPIGIYLKTLPQVKEAVKKHNEENPWDRRYMWHDPGFSVETRDDFVKAMSELNTLIEVMDDYAGYSIYDLD